METIHADGTPLAAYLEGQLDEAAADSSPDAPDTLGATKSPFAPSSNSRTKPTIRRLLSLPPRTQLRPQSSISRIHDAWSKAVNSRLGRADNERFLEHFRYIIVASQLLNEYLDQGSLLPGAACRPETDGTREALDVSFVKTDVYGAVATAAVAFALVYVIHWARSSRSGILNKGRIALAVAVFILIAFVSYAYVRRQWLKYLRRQAITAVSTLTTNWQAFEISTTSAVSFIQEVELVSKGYRLSTPLPPASRIEEQGGPRRCARLRKVVHKAYASLIPACVEACDSLRTLIDEDNLEKYFEVYDISSIDAKESCRIDGIEEQGNDPESLKSLRVFSYRAGILRRVALCSLMALEADGGKPDFYRWRVATDVMEAIGKVIGEAAEKICQILNETDSITIPQSPVRAGPSPAREKMRSQVRKISMLSSGIRGLQAKMQVLREETNRSIEQSDDLTDIGPSLMAQYESIGADLKELMQAWEEGKTSLQSNITKQEQRISMASSASGLRSPLSSISGLTAVEEGGTPADALKALNGDVRSNRSSMATTPSDEEQVFEAIAMPKQRSALTREERIAKMQEDREKQATRRAKRESDTRMLRELQSVINLRPKKDVSARITSI
ncbi:hypothetical protein M433DRAFT_113280 [Acidomyces richmondensis BFW]|nr:hypothetical protein M433DRAFT_113280 [Acidomyces richmondensis BFW]